MIANTVYAVWQMLIDLLIMYNTYAHITRKFMIIVSIINFNRLTMRIWHNIQWSLLLRPNIEKSIHHLWYKFLSKSTYRCYSKWNDIYLSSFRNSWVQKIYEYRLLKYHNGFLQQQQLSWALLPQATASLLCKYYYAWWIWCNILTFKCH